MTSADSEPKRTDSDTTESNASSGYEYPPLEDSATPTANSHIDPMPGNAYPPPGYQTVHEYPTFPESPVGPYGAYPPNAWYPQPGYGNPAYGYPPYGYPPYGYRPPPTTNGLAISSLVVSLFSPIFCILCLIPALVGIVLGFLALHQLKSSPQQGKGIAVAGIIIGVLVFLMWLFCFIAISQSPPPTDFRST